MTPVLFQGRDAAHLPFTQIQLFLEPFDLQALVSTAPRSLAPPSLGQCGSSGKRDDQGLR